eukprot:scaffold1695_cov167-Amphora_coffeaeformis.AAC.2
MYALLGLVKPAVGADLLFCRLKIIIRIYQQNKALRLITVDNFSELFERLDTLCSSSRKTTKKDDGEATEESPLVNVYKLGLSDDSAA